MAMQWIVGLRAGVLAAAVCGLTVLGPAGSANAHVYALSGQTSATGDASGGGGVHDLGPAPDCAGGGGVHD